MLTCLFPGFGFVRRFYGPHLCGQQIGRISMFRENVVPNESYTAFGYAIILMSTTQSKRRMKFKDCQLYNGRRRKNAMSKDTHFIYTVYQV